MSGEQFAARSPRFNASTDQRFSAFLNFPRNLAQNFGQYNCEQAQPGSEKTKVSQPKSKKIAPAEESGNQRPKHRKEKLIRLDDLIPKENVMGGRQLPFGVRAVPGSMLP